MCDFLLPDDSFIFEVFLIILSCAPLTICTAIAKLTYERGQGNDTFYPYLLLKPKKI